MRRSVGCTFVVALLVVPVCAQSADEELRPDWMWHMRPGIEWATLVGPADWRTVLVATRTADLRLIDARTGRQRLTPPIEVAPGVRPAAVESANAGADVTYCFDRHAAYAIRLSKPAGLKWRHGPLPADAARFQGDPEELTGWLAATVSDAGLLLIGSDGRVLLLSHDDGHVLWKLDMQRPTLVRPHVCDDGAALLWKTASGTSVVFLRLSDTRPTPIIRDLGVSWPLWSALLSEGLLTATVEGVTLWPVTGQPRRLESRVRPPAATAMDVCREPSILLMAGEGGVSAWSPSGKPIWRQSRVAGPGREIERLLVRGTRVVVTGSGGVSALDVAIGRVLGEYRRPTVGTIVAAQPIGDRLYVLNRAAAGALSLARIELEPPGTSRPAEDIRRSREFRLLPEQEAGERGQSGAAGGIRSVFWTDHSVILVETDRLRAYTLPQSDD